MATTETAIVDASALQKYDRRANGSPPPLSTKPPSKKLKRDQMLNERLNSLGEEAAKNPDPRFRELLQRIQVDTNLVQSFDMRSDRPLDAIEEEQLKLRQQSAGQNAVSRGPQTLLEMCGPKFEDFVIYLQDLLEEKDYGLSKAKVRKLSCPADISLSLSLLSRWTNPNGSLTTRKNTPSSCRRTGSRSKQPTENTKCSGRQPATALLIILSLRSTS